MKSVSRFVTKPRSLAPICPFSVTGNPVKPEAAIATSHNRSKHDNQH